MFMADVIRLSKRLKSEIKLRSRKFLFQSRSVSEMLEAFIRKYPNRTIETAAELEALLPALLARAFKGEL